ATRVRLVPGPARRHHRGRRHRRRRVPLPGHRQLGGRARPPGRGAEPGPADHAAAARAVVRTRAERSMRLLAADPGTGRSAVLREDTDPVWLEVVPGVPAWTA